MNEAVVHFNKFLEQYGEPRQCPTCLAKLKKHVADLYDNDGHFITATYTCPKCRVAISRERWRLTEKTNKQEEEKSYGEDN